MKLRIASILLLAYAPLGAGWSARAAGVPQAQGDAAGTAQVQSEQVRLLEALLPAAQREAWQALASDEERRAFAERFWRSLDPTPGTPANELRRIFERRARLAAELFADERRPWYETDRARVLVTYGLPDEQELRAGPAATDGDRVVWRYRSAGRTIEFALEEGSARLLEAPALGLDAFRRSALPELRLMLGGAAAVRATSTADAGAAAAKAEDVGPAAEVAPEVRVWMQMVFGGRMRDEIGLRHRLSFFPAREGTYTILSFEVDKEKLSFEGPADATAQQAGAAEEAEAGAGAQQAGAAEEAVTGAGAQQEGAGAAPSPRAHLRLFGAWLQGEAGHETTVHRFDLPFEVAVDDGDERASALRSVVVTLLPGRYRLAWGVYDEGSALATTRDEVVEVPDFASAGELRLSSIVLAEPPHAQDPTPIGVDRVYRGMRLGGMLMDDDLDRLFDRDAIVEVVVMVAGWSQDPNAPGHPRLEVEYRIVQGERGIARLPAQTLDFFVMGQQIPLAQVRRLEPGQEYAIEVRVRDLAADREVVGRAPFRLAPAAAPQPQSSDR